MGHGYKETCACETSGAPQTMLDMAAAALAAHESSAVIENGANIAWQLLCVREKLEIEKDAGHQMCRLIIEALVELGLDLPAMVAAPYDATVVNDLCKSLPAKVRAVVKQRDEAIAERDGLRDSRARWQQHCADSANKYADQRDEALREVERLKRELAKATERSGAILNEPAESEKPSTVFVVESPPVVALPVCDNCSRPMKYDGGPDYSCDECGTKYTAGPSWPEAERMAAVVLGKKDCEDGVRRRSFNAICRAILGAPTTKRPDLERAYHLAYDQAVEWRAWPHKNNPHPLIAGTRVTNETPARWRFVDSEDRPISWKLIEAGQSEDTSK